tara:strand:- start:14 stop:490 length:477 start_codon:yes stop_codon:yes gene_type:complete
MSQYQLLDNVSRWLNQEEYTHIPEKNEDSVFRIKVEDSSGIHIFEPKKQKGVLVIELAINIPTKLDNLYKKYSDNEKKKLKKDMEENARQEEIELRFFSGAEGIKSNLYIVIDNKENLHFTFFKEQLDKITEVGDIIGQFLICIAAGNASDLKQQKGR